MNWLEAESGFSLWYTVQSTFASLTFCWKKVSADESSIHVLQQDDALLWRHAEEVVETVVRERSVTEAHQTDAVAKFACQRRAETQAQIHFEPGLAFQRFAPLLNQQHRKLT